MDDETGSYVYVLVTDYGGYAGQSLPSQAFLRLKDAYQARRIARPTWIDHALVIYRVPLWPTAEDDEPKEMIETEAEDGR